VKLKYSTNIPTQETIVKKRKKKQLQMPNQPIRIQTQKQKLNTGKTPTQSNPIVSLIQNKNIIAEKC
jgi:hypothetical protein